jgi:predicted nucleotidyltransferase
MNIVFVLTCFMIHGIIFILFKIRAARENDEEIINEMNRLEITTVDVVDKESLKGLSRAKDY